MVVLRKEDIVPLTALRPASKPERAPLALVRTDTLPEDTDYRDTGCSLAPSCLSCPLPQCRYDEPRSARRLSNHARDTEIVLLRTQHAAPIEAIASAYGLTTRQVYRIMRRAADAERRSVMETGRSIR
jgi:hypothetical protein